ncbi:MAG TPA: hypothetical protein VME19_21315 [Streptosporangiaceae bacterium]|nr:hypothetical protein [Streptosporangiaceae bacterium]
MDLLTVRVAHYMINLMKPTDRALRPAGNIWRSGEDPVTLDYSGTV